MNTPLPNKRHTSSVHVIRVFVSSPGDVAEERRLFFVGLTRARDRLYLTHARQRLWRGQVREMPPSPFLEQIREELLERIQQTQGRKQRKSPDTQLQLF